MQTLAKLNGKSETMMLSFLNLERHALSESFLPWTEFLTVTKRKCTRTGSKK